MISDMEGEMDAGTRAEVGTPSGMLDREDHMEGLGRRNRLKEFRMKALLNQKELSERSGVNPWTISKIEHGQRLPGVEVAYKLARALGVSIEDIFFSGDIGQTPICNGRNSKGKS